MPYSRTINVSFTGNRLRAFLDRASRTFSVNHRFGERPKSTKVGSANLGHITSAIG
jgi:hypothetical protein